MQSYGEGGREPEENVGGQVEFKWLGRTDPTIFRHREESKIGVRALRRHCRLSVVIGGNLLEYFIGNAGLPN